MALPATCNLTVDLYNTMYNLINRHSALVSVKSNSRWDTGLQCLINILSKISIGAKGWPVVLRRNEGGNEVAWFLGFRVWLHRGVKAHSQI